MSLKQMLRDQTPLVGTFLKTPSAMVCEVLGRSDLDVICLDAEHSPFDRGDINDCVLALRHVGKPSLVRIPANRPEQILNALDCGATGVLVPHVITGEDAESLAGNAHFGTGRGYAGSSRAAGYGARNMAEHKARSAEETVVIAQIEDAEALDNLDAIFAAATIDAFFIGRADLSVSLGADGPNDPQVIEAVEAICAKGREAGVSIGMFTGNLDELPKWCAAGASLFLLGSDHGFMLTGAAQMAKQVRSHF
ncbi:MAG: aldolase/citrate lyase family protein [Hyphomonadaceae bacterium]|nr:aldolase/citrate lyase family protein [Hyphomonadaceae bacterium]